MAGGSRNLITGHSQQNSSTPGVTGMNDPHVPNMRFETVRWTRRAIDEYHQWIRDNAEKYAASEEKMDCADWAFVMLIRFARPRDLPVRFEKVGSGELGGLRQSLT